MVPYMKDKFDISPFLLFSYYICLNNHASVKTYPKPSQFLNLLRQIPMNIAEKETFIVRIQEILVIND